jgi:hypothetical protein
VVFVSGYRAAQFTGGDRLLRARISRPGNAIPSSVGVVSGVFDAIEELRLALICGEVAETSKERPMSGIIDKMRTASKWMGGKRTFAAGAGLAMILNCAYAEGDFPIEGIFTQNELCRGDGSQQQFLRVKVTAQDVSYSGGICSIDSKQQDGNSLAMRVTCKFSSGAVMASAVTFTKKDNDTFDMAQNEGTYKAVLHRCPG